MSAKRKKLPSTGVRLVQARIEGRLQGDAERKKLAERLSRTEHEARELRTRLEALAWQARKNAPPSIKDHADLWVVAVEAMAERAKYVADVATGVRP